MDQMCFSLLSPLIAAKMFGKLYTKHKKILKTGEKKADWPGALRSKEWHSEVSFPGFLFVSFIPDIQVVSEEAEIGT